MNWSGYVTQFVTLVMGDLGALLCLSVSVLISSGVFNHRISKPSLSFGLRRL